MDSPKRHTVRCAGYVFLIKEDRILLILREKTGWMDGYYGLPAGHLEKNEEIKETVIREAEEEVGIKINPDDLIFIHVMHRHEEGNFEYIDFYFSLDRWEGDPVNNEPNKASKVEWFDLHALPKNTIPNVRAAIAHYLSHIIFSEFS